MKASAIPLFARRLRDRISSSPLVVDANEDGWPEIFVGGPVLSGFEWNGDALPRWPKRGRRPFASSPTAGDINGDGRPEVVCGCDDGRVYAFFADGSSVPGWPFRTGRDVFSTPALADLDSDRALEVIVGSDDGILRALRGDGEPLWIAELPGRPFVSASPTVADLDADKSLEIAVGAWDRGMYVWSSDGLLKTTGFPRARHVVWSSATAFETPAGERLLSWASDAVYVASGTGAMAAGWPAHTESWMVSSPAVVDLGSGVGPVVTVGAERLYAWNASGQILSGWPKDCGDYVWASPIAFDVDGDGFREILVGAWDGRVHAFRADGSAVPGFPLSTDGAIFASPAAAPLPEGGGLLVAASWDGTIRGWQLPNARFAPGDWLQFRGSPTRTGAQTKPLDFQPTLSLPAQRRFEQSVIHGAVVQRWGWKHLLERIVVEGQGLANAEGLQVFYEIRGEGRQHPVPVVNSRGRFVALVQPLRLPHRIRFAVELTQTDGRVERWPIAGWRSYVSTPGIFRRLAVTRTRRRVGPDSTRAPESTEIEAVPQTRI